MLDFLNRELETLEVQNRENFKSQFDNMKQHFTSALS